MQYTHLAALVAVAQPLVASAAYLPAREASSAASYHVPNQTESVYGSSGMLRATGASGRLGHASSTGHVVPHTTGKANSTRHINSSAGIHTTLKKTEKNSTGTATDDGSDDADATSGAAQSEKTNAPPGAIGGLGLDAPVWNLNNSTCSDFSFLNASGMWARVDGDTVVRKYEDIFNNNLLICDDCYGMPKDQCDSKKPECSQGLRDLAKIPGQDQPRWDTGAARFSGNAGLTDLQCRVQTGVCEGAPSCDDCNGPGSFAILKSLQVMNNALMNTYNAIQDAGQHCTNQMQQFSSTFAPIPDTKNEAMFLGILTSVVGGLFGFIPGVGGAIGGMMAGVGASVGMDMFYFNQPGPADTSSVLGMITNMTSQKYVDVADSLFTTGSYTYTSADGKKGAQITLAKMMQNGALMQSTAGPKDLYTALVPMYEKIMYQQLAAFTWKNMEKDKKKHIPFIVFSPGSCDKVNDKTKGFGRDDVLSGVPDIKSGITYNDTCYWLLDGTKTTKQTGFSRGGSSSINICSGAQALPGGTTDDMTKNAQVFSDLSLEDFIIPSVEGWLKNGKNNDYEVASSNGQLVSDPRTAGSVNFPVCDYVGNKDMPGVNCPKLGAMITGNGGCDTVPRNAIANKPGDFATGNCKVHIKQYQRNEGDQNPFNDYQLEIDIFDDADRKVGGATKQRANVPLSVGGSLPYELIVATGKDDKSPIEFWYAADYWNSDDKSHSCSVGGYDHGARQMDCGFSCPSEQPKFGDSSSATIGHKLPASPTEAVRGDATYVNTYVSPSATATPTATSKPEIPKEVASGECKVHVRQHQKHESDNPTGDYQLEVTLNSNEDKPVGSSGMVPAPEGKAITVNGLGSPMNITTQSVDKDPLKFTLGSSSWDSSANDKNKKPYCSVGKYDSGHRDMDCWMPCNP